MATFGIPHERVRLPVYGKPRTGRRQSCSERGTDSAARDMGAVTRCRYRFRPGLWPTLAVLLLLPLLLGLGFWQLDRAEQKRAWLAQLAAAAQQEAVNLNAVQPDYPAVAQRRVEARGRYDADRQLLLDNQIRAGRQGYLVLTPLRLAGSEWAVDRKSTRLNSSHVKISY